MNKTNCDFENKFLGRSGVGNIYENLVRYVPHNLLNKFQIIVDHTDQFEILDETKIRIFWAHLDPEQNEEVSTIVESDQTPLANGGWKKYHKIVFISNHQMERWIKKYDIPRSHCTVIKYALNPLDFKKKPNDKIILFHHPSPQRGLSLLIDVFEELCKEYFNLELIVCSSYKIYTEKSNNFLKIFDEKQLEYENSELYLKMEKHTKIRNIGYLPNEELRNLLSSSHIFVYPSIMIETFCLSLLESMSAGLLCVHSNYGCLAETASNWTMMYDYHEDITEHKKILYKNLKKSINEIKKEEIIDHLKKQKEYVDYHYNWERRKKEWINLLLELEKMPLLKIKKTPTIRY